MPNSLKPLLPCPFCGSENIDAQGWASTDSAGPACDDCGASAGGVKGTLQDNITTWNTRANVLHHTAPLRYALENAARSIKSLRGVMDSYASEIEALRAEVRTLVRQNGEWQAHAERLAEALQLARDLVEYWAGYASEHFQKKHNLEGDLALLDDALRDHEQEVGNWTCEMRPND